MDRRAKPEGDVPTSFSGARSVTVHVAAEIAEIVPEILAIAVDVGHLPLGRAGMPGPHIAEQLPLVTPQIDTVAMDIADVGTDVRAAPAGRRGRWHERGPADRRRRYKHQ